MFYVQDQRVISDNCDHQTAGPADSRNMINYGMKETVLFALAMRLPIIYLKNQIS